MTETQVSFFYESSRLPQTWLRWKIVSPSLVVLANYLRRRESGLRNVSDVSSGIRGTLTNTLHLWLRRWFYSVNIEIAWRTRKLISDFCEKKKKLPAQNFIRSKRNIIFVWFPQVQFSAKCGRYASTFF